MKPAKAIAAVVVLGGLGFIAWQRYQEPQEVEEAPAVQRVSEAKAVQILQNANQATAAVSRLSYNAHYEIEGRKKGRQSGKVRMDQDREWTGVTVVDESGEEEPKPLYDASTDGETVYLAAHAEKDFVHGQYPERAVLLQRGRNLMLPEFGGDDPFDEELKAYARYEGKRTVGDEECDVVYVEYKTPGTHARWYFGSDGLPRRVDRLSNMYEDLPAEQRICKTLTLTDLQIEPQFALAEFQMTAPEGYEDIELKPAPPLLAVGSDAPDWTLKTPTGRTVSLASLKDKVVLMDFWATWCGPCKMAMPHIQKFHEQFSGRPVEVVGVNCQDPDGDPAGYMKSKDYTYTLLLDGDKVAEAYNVAGLPTFYVIGKDGKVAYSSVGSGHEEKLGELIETLLVEGETVAADLGS